MSLFVTFDPLLLKIVLALKLTSITKGYLFVTFDPLLLLKIVPALKLTGLKCYLMLFICNIDLYLLLIMGKSITQMSLIVTLIYYNC